MELFECHLAARQRDFFVGSQDVALRHNLRDALNFARTTAFARPTGRARGAGVGGSAGIPGTLRDLMVPEPFVWCLCLHCDAFVLPTVMDCGVLI
jgi:hypothetical protein